MGLSNRCLFPAILEASHPRSLCWCRFWWFTGGHLLASPSRGREREKKKKRSKLSDVSCYKGTNPIYEDHPLMTSSKPDRLPKPPPPNAITRGFQHMNLGETHSVHNSSWHKGLLGGAGKRKHVNFLVLQCLSGHSTQPTVNSQSMGTAWQWTAWMEHVRQSWILVMKTNNNRF